MRLYRYHRVSLLSACLLLLTFLAVVGGQELPQWTAPVPLTTINTQYHDKSAFLSFDGLTLYWAQEDGPGWHYSRLYRAMRPSLDDPFGAPEEISTLNHVAGHVTSPWVSPDNLRMYYYCTGNFGAQLRLSERASAGEEWSPGASVAELNQLGRIATSTLTEDERVVVFCGLDLPGGRGSWDLWMADRPGREAPFGDITNLTALNSEAWDGQPSMSPDGLTLYFMSKRQGRPQIYRAQRASRDETFGSVTHMAVFDIPDANVSFPCITPDQRTFYFAGYPRNGNVDLYVSQAIEGYWVDGANGDDVADGQTPQTAVATIQRAIEMAQDGQIVNVRPGTYREGVDFLGKAITVRSAGDAAILEAPDQFAVSFYMGEGRDSVLRNFVITNSYIGIFVLGASPTITNVTVVGNEFGIEAYRDADPAISNSIFWDNAVSDLYDCSASYSCTQKDIQRSGTELPFVWVYPPLSEDREWPPLFGDGASFVSWPVRAVRSDPLFVDPNNGDYHLRSARGRYWPAHDVWVLDNVTSPCIDAGDPAADFSQERLPNGGRLNMGAYGGTPFASMSESPYRTDFNGDRTVDANDLEEFTDTWEAELEASQPQRRR